MHGFAGLAAWWAFYPLLLVFALISVDPRAVQYLLRSLREDTAQVAKWLKI